MPPVTDDEVQCTPLDGGWGWVVVFAAFISIGFSYSTPKALSIFYHDIQEDLLVSYSDIAWISSIMLATMYAGGPVSSVLVSRFGSRPVVIVGGLMCGVSMVAASFGNSIIHLYFFIGVIGGCGLSLNLNASVTIISKYFLAKRPLANGLAMAGSPVFLCFLAPLSQTLLHYFGWRGSFLVLGALILNCCVAGSLMRPVTPSNNPSSGSPQKKMEEQTDNCHAKPKGSCMNSAVKFLDFSLFKDRGFITYLIGNMLFSFAAYAPIVFMAAYATSQGVDEYSASYLLSIMGFVDMFARPGTGLVANSKYIRPRVQYFFGFAMVFNGMCHLLCPLAKGYAFLAVYAAFFGLGFGMVFALIFECLMDIMGPQRFPSAVGLVTVIQCCPMLLGPPTGGALVDISGDYRYIFYMCGSLSATGGLFLFVMNIYNYHMLEKERTMKDIDQNHKTTGDQDLVKVSEAHHAEMQQVPEAVMEQAEPEAADKNSAQGDPRPENTETPHNSTL